MFGLSRPGSDPSLRQPERRWRGLDDSDDRHRPPRSLLIALVLASITLMTVDHQASVSSGLEAARSAAGEVFGPVETGASTLVRPFTDVPDWLRTKSSLTTELRELKTENAELRQAVRTAGFDRNRLQEYDSLTKSASDLGRALVPARVVGYGPAQSFTQTVTIDAGSAAGVRPDHTVINADGLVGRVLRVTRTTATVLLIADAESVVGARVGGSMEIGFLKGRGGSGDTVLDLELIGQDGIPDRGDSVVTWGSNGTGPYVSGIPIGTVGDVYASMRDQSHRAVIKPYVDFHALDLVGVVVPSGATSDRAVIEADGSVQ